MRLQQNDGTGETRSSQRQFSCSSRPLRFAWWAPSCFVFWHFSFFVLQNTVNVFQVSCYNEISGQSSKSSHIWDARWGLRGWLASGQFLFSLSLFPFSPPPAPRPPNSIDPMEPWVTGTGGRKILLFLPLCFFWIQGWDRETRRILKRGDSENTENKDNNVYTKGLSDDMEAWIQYLRAVLITTRKLKNRKMTEAGYLQEVGFRGVWEEWCKVVAFYYKPILNFF